MDRGKEASFRPHKSKRSRVLQRSSCAFVPFGVAAFRVLIYIASRYN